MWTFYFKKCGPLLLQGSLSEPTTPPGYEPAQYTLRIVLSTILQSTASIHLWTYTCKNTQYIYFQETWHLHLALQVTDN